MSSSERDSSASDVPQSAEEAPLSPEKREAQRERSKILRDVAVLLPELLGSEFSIPRAADITLIPNDATITWWEIRSALQYLKECRIARKQAAEKAAKAKGALERAQAKVAKSTERRDALKHQVSKSNDKRLANQLNEAEGTLAKHVEELAATPAQIEAWQQQDHEAGQALEIAERVVGTMQDTLCRAAEILRATVPKPAEPKPAPESPKPDVATVTPPTEESPKPKAELSKNKSKERKPERPKYTAPNHLRPGESSGPNVRNSFRTAYTNASLREALRAAESRDLARMAALPRLTDPGFAPFARPGSPLQTAYSTKLTPVVNAMFFRGTTQPFDPVMRAKGLSNIGYHYVTQSGHFDSFQAQAGFDCVMGRVEVNSGTVNWCRDMLSALNVVVQVERAEAGGDLNAFMVNKYLCAGSKLGLANAMVEADLNRRLYLAMQLARLPENSATAATRITHIGLVRQILTNVMFGTKPEQVAAQMRLAESLDIVQHDPASFEVPYSVEECLYELDQLRELNIAGGQMMRTFIDKLFALITVEHPSKDRAQLTGVTLNQWNFGYQPMAIAKERGIEAQLPENILSEPAKRRFALAHVASIEMQKANSGSVGQALAAARLSRAIDLN